MSSFSSVIQKPGKKIVPKAAPRRNVQRKPRQEAVTAALISQPDIPHTETEAPLIPQVIASADSPAENELIIDEASATEHSVPALTEPRRTDTVEQLCAAPASQIEIVTPQSIVSDVEPEQTLERSQPSVRPQETESTPQTTIIDDTGSVEDVQTRKGSTIDPNIGNSTLQETDSQSIQSRPSTNNVVDPGEIRDNSDLNLGSRKRRKVTPRAAPELALSQNTIAPLVSPSPGPAHPSTRSQNNPNHPTEDLLQSATQRAASVSELANNIESQTRLLHPNFEQNIVSEPSSEFEGDSSGASRSTSSQPRRTRRKKTLQEQAADIVAAATGKRKGSARQRDSMPENAESYELEPTKVTMGELCEDTRLGKKSTLETEMQANWTEILQRRKEDRERALVNAESRRRKGIGHKHVLNLSHEPVAALAPAMAVVNGVIVVEQASREIDRSAQLQAAANQDLDNVREDRDYYKYVNQGTVGVKPGHGRHSKWDEESNERFFKALRMFGTDFLMIANMFPGLTRKQIKAKFIREENADKARVLECLRNQEPVQLEDYANMANKETEEFQTLESIQKELDEQEKRLRDEDNQRRRREGFTTTANADNAEDSVPGETGDGTEGQAGSTEHGRFDSIAREIVEAAVGSKKRQRKSTTVSSRRGPKGGRRPEGGVEEILGSITEVAV